MKARMQQHTKPIYDHRNLYIHLSIRKTSVKLRVYLKVSYACWQIQRLEWFTPKGSQTRRSTRAACSSFPTPQPLQQELKGAPRTRPARPALPFSALLLGGSLARNWVNSRVGAELRPWTGRLRCRCPAAPGFHPYTRPSHPNGGLPPHPHRRAGHPPRRWRAAAGPGRQPRAETSGKKTEKTGLRATFSQPPPPPSPRRLTGPCSRHSRRLVSMAPPHRKAPPGPVRLRHDPGGIRKEREQT